MDKVKNCRPTVGASCCMIDTRKAVHSLISIIQPNGSCVAQVAQNNVPVNYKAVEAKARADL